MGEINQRMFALLDQKGYSQRDFAKNTGISEKTLSAWKARGTDPSAKYISSIAEFLECDENYLLTGEQPHSQEILLHGGGGDKITAEDIALLKKADAALDLEWSLQKRLQKLSFEDMKKLKTIMDWMNFPH
ncbi:helix-turn-helix domain-containing protein [Oscillospiraceae bacterium OttesenSCG-928-F05]|nr:helix-turn-helix domain-containing protein [Oscillospiraceae bacterium OttesenSCG-928-F05]